MNTGRIITTALAASILAIPAMAADAPGYFKVPGTDTTMKIYGYAVLDAAYDLNEGLGNFGTIVGTPFPKAGPTDQWTMTANRSRFGITTTTPSSLGDVTTKIEGDFLAGTFRLRHGYMSVGGFLAGKTWSNFLDLDAAPDTVDFNGSVAASNFDTPRFAQLRYTFDLSKQASLGFSFENDSTGSNTHSFPGAITGQFTFADSWGHVSARILSQKYAAWTVATPLVGERTVSKNCMAFQLSGNANIGKDNLVASFYTGDALGAYGAALQQAVVFQADGSLKAQKSTGITLGYTHVWSDAVRSNIAIAELKYKKDADVLLTTSAVEKIDQLFLNTFWSPTKTTEFGIEYVWAKATAFDKDVYTLHDGSKSDTWGQESRIQFAFKATLF